MVHNEKRGKNSKRKTRQSHVHKGKKIASDTNNTRQIITTPPAKKHGKTPQNEKHVNNTYTNNKKTATKRKLHRDKKNQTVSSHKTCVRASTRRSRRSYLTIDYIVESLAEAQPTVELACLLKFRSVQFWGLDRPGAVIPSTPKIARGSPPRRRWH